MESVIRGQMEAGTYIDSNEAYLADSFVRNELADMLFFLLPIRWVPFRKNWDFMGLIIQRIMRRLLKCCHMKMMSA